MAIPEPNEADYETVEEYADAWTVYMRDQFRVAKCLAWSEGYFAGANRTGANNPYWDNNELPVGLCGNRDDHAPHRVDSAPVAGGGPFWCCADQTKRLPFALERKN